MNCVCGVETMDRVHVQKILSIKLQSCVCEPIVIAGGVEVAVNMFYCRDAFAHSM